MHRFSKPSPRALAAAAVLALSAALLAACGHHRAHHHAKPHGFTSDATTLEVVTTQVGGKNVFIPSTIVVTSGRPHTLSFFNTTEIPHGFRISALGIEAVIPAQEEYLVELPALEGHRVLHIDCHLHPPHRSATLVVLPARRER